ncbi:MAG: alpha/beta fold hydrolase [Clostridiales bacterium]|nr:alpha/beta fold hydrolase [Clostridiales bacterium]
MYINDDGIKLHVELEKPDDAPLKMPLVIVIHGFTGHMEEDHIVAAAKACRDQGYATLRVEMYGHGQSEGEFKDHTLLKWIGNALTVIDYARTLDFVTDIYLCGHSQGGLMVMLAGGLKHEFIKGLIELAPAAMIPELSRKGELLGFDYDPNNIPEVLEIKPGFVLGNNYARVAQLIHIDDAIDMYDGPVLIVQGTNDYPELIESAKYAAGRYKDCKYVEIEGSEHCYNGYLPQMTEAIKGWLPKI